MHETYWSLLKDPAHWLFELTLMGLFDGLLGLLVWPFLRKHWQHHVNRDIRDSSEYHQEYFDSYYDED